MSRMDEIRKQLQLPSPAQIAWGSLSVRQRYLFIRLAHLTAYAKRLLKPDYDSFQYPHRLRIAEAIMKTEAIANKFTAQIRPAKAIKTKKLRAAA
jgi:hypothetical protein